MKPRVLSSPAEMISLRNTLGAKSIGFVPTMGALHKGHEELLRRARQENEICILSIFVNPTQFNNMNDLDHYPKTWASDLALAEKNNVDYVFAPSYQDMYPDQYRYKILENEFSKSLCGKDRPGHFDGVLTVVMKLFNLVAPAKAYFGEKDFQQLRLIQGMKQAFFIPLEIVSVPTVRELDGLAMSSRNMRLSPGAREKAPLIYQEIKTATTAAEASQNLESAGFQVDYVTDISNRRFVAAKLGEVRLIDNVEL